MIGQRVPLELLTAVAPGAADGVDEALARGVLTDDGATLGFRHELIRQAIESAISAPRRATLHGAVVAALARMSPATEPARLAHHAELAGLAGEASRYAALAAQDAERVGALREAALQLDRALRLRADLPADERFELLLRFSRAANSRAACRTRTPPPRRRSPWLSASSTRGRGRALNLLAAALWSLDQLEEAGRPRGRPSRRSSRPRTSPSSPAPMPPSSASRRSPSTRRWRSAPPAARWSWPIAPRRRTHAWTPRSVSPSPRAMVEALARLRRGIEGGDELLAGAAAALASVPEGARHGLVRAALAEAAWLHDDRVGMREHALAGLRSAHADQFARSAGELALWASRAGAPVEPPARMHDPVRRELEGDWRGAIDAWRALDAPYEAALAALPGDERAARQAVAALQRLGAPAAARAFARDRALHGASALRGPRRSTLANAAGLTRREQEVLEHVAARRHQRRHRAGAHLSHRTVEHHVSAILAKLGATTRTAAVDAARAAGVLSRERT